MLDTIALPIEVRHIILVLLSCLSGFIIGYERKSKHKQARRKTHILVALTATLMMILSKEAFLDTPNYDTSRVAAQIVSGISFIGGGIIFMRDKKLAVSPQQPVFGQLQGLEWRLEQVLLFQAYFVV